MHRPGGQCWTDPVNNKSLLRQLGLSATGMTGTWRGGATHEPSLAPETRWHAGGFMQLASTETANDDGEVIATLAVEQELAPSVALVKAPSTLDPSIATGGITCSS